MAAAETKARENDGLKKGEERGIPSIAGIPAPFVLLSPSLVPSVLNCASVAVPPFVKTAFRVYLGVLMVFASAAHFNRKYMKYYCDMIPEFFPGDSHGYVCISGLIGMIIGVLLILPRTALLGAWLCIGYLIGVFPANIKMAMYPEKFKGLGFTSALAYSRLVLQFTMIAYAHWFTHQKT
mmetsp:Transcript_7633/g.23134  ORF Transcript_7633/g.23134 Transcript_7633/m.23134 type:complete len:180 (+) Transcript_7633:439-978(+)|eukprot:CAMPEP_0198732184 /NCGR_PEP_ID=MMETSP1475-20131203/34286_1 /TAXON_ID= ORGANISM="Unidentified sp., Strain CCMP1999" /NCGR_SAMPLE_ID=MMETSP1475 /ASSEMBLY_ACC=CAM_ASM_001111 /LENGTH=179 /DNA_ID=CAMNT_0044495249 /DNA_START=390 /DNA_END=932 /DNA_ORIENTATION=-